MARLHKHELQRFLPANWPKLKEFVTETLGILSKAELTSLSCYSAFYKYSQANAILLGDGNGHQGPYIGQVTGTADVHNRGAVAVSDLIKRIKPAIEALESVGENALGRGERELAASCARLISEFPKKIDFPAEAIRIDNEVQKRLERKEKREETAASGIKPGVQREFRKLVRESREASELVH